MGQLDPHDVTTVVLGTPDVPAADVRRVLGYLQELQRLEMVDRVGPLWFQTSHEAGGS